MSSREGIAHESAHSSLSSAVVWAHSTEQPSSAGTIAPNEKERALQQDRRSMLATALAEKTTPSVNEIALNSARNTQRHPLTTLAFAIRRLYHTAFGKEISHKPYKPLIEDTHHATLGSNAPYLLDPRKPIKNPQLKQAVDLILYPKKLYLAIGFLLAFLSALSYWIAGENTRAERAPQIITTLVNFFFYFLLYSELLQSFVEICRRLRLHFHSHVMAVKHAEYWYWKIWHIVSRIALLATQIFSIGIVAMIGATNAFPLFSAVILIPEAGEVPCWGSSYMAEASSISECWQSLFSATWLLLTECLTTTPETVSFIYFFAIPWILKHLVKLFDQFTSFACGWTTPNLPGRILRETILAKFQAHIDTLGILSRQENDLDLSHTEIIRKWATELDQSENPFDLMARAFNLPIDKLPQTQQHEKRWVKILEWVNKISAAFLNLILVLCFAYGSLVGLTFAAPDLIGRMTGNKEGGVAGWLLALKTLHPGWQLLLIMLMNLPDICLLTKLVKRCIPNLIKVIQHITKGVTAESSNLIRLKTFGLLFLAVIIFPALTLFSLTGMIGSWDASVEIARQIAETTENVGTTLPNNDWINAYMRPLMVYISGKNLFSPEFLWGTLFVLIIAWLINISPLYNLWQDFEEARKNALRIPFIPASDQPYSNSQLAAKLLRNAISPLFDTVSSPLFEPAAVFETVEIDLNPSEMLPTQNLRVKACEGHTLPPVSCSTKASLVLAIHASQEREIKPLPYDDCAMYDLFSRITPASKAVAQQKVEYLDIEPHYQT